MTEDGSPVIPESDRAAEELSSREAELRKEIERERHEKAVLEERHQFEILERLKVKDELQEYMAGDKEVISELRSKNGELESRISRLEEGIGGRLRKERRSQRLANIEAGIRERETEDEVEFDGSGGTVSGGDSSPPRPARRGRGRPRKMSGNKKGMKKTRKDETEDAEEDEVDLDCDGSGSSASEGDFSAPPPLRGRGRPCTKRNANLQMSGNKKQMKKTRRRKSVRKQKYRDADHVQYRCNMLAFLKIMQKVKERLTKSHLELLQQTPFWPLISAFYNGMISESDCKKSESDINGIIRCYNSNSMCFEFGSTSASLTPEDISMILGLPQEGETLKVRGLFGVNRYTSDFVERYFMDEKRVKKTMVDDGLDKALQGKRETDREDVVRLIILELFITFLFCNAGSTIGWKLVRCCEELENMSRYSWAKAVADFLSSTLEKTCGQYGPYSTGGCVIVLLFWLCERTNLIQPVEGRERHTPALIKWNIQELHLKLQRMKDFEDLGRSFEGAKENHERNGQDKEEDGKGIGENEETEEEEDRREETETDRGEESVSDDIVGPLEDELRAQMSHEYELLNTFESQEKCAGLEVKVESAVREKERAEQRCKEIEEKHAFEVSEKAKIQRDYAFLWENYQLERNEKLRVEERCNVMGKKVEVEISERRRVEEKYSELEERHDLERLERLNVEHELKVLDEKHQLVVEELRRFEKKCGELEERSEILMLEKLNAEDECRGLEEKKRLEVEEKRKVEKEYAELWEKHKSELLQKAKVGIMYKELKEKHQKVEEEYEKLDESHNFDMLERIKMEKECKEVAEKYRIEVMEKRKVEEKYDALVEKYRDVMMEILKEHGEIHERHQFEQQEKLKLKRECEELKEKIELLCRAQESEKGEENVMFDKKYGVLQEKYEFERLENLKMWNEFKELMEFHRLELLAKIKAENDLKECQAQLEGLQEEVIAASERYDKLLEEARKGRKAEDKGLVFECQNNNVDSQNRMCKETFELQASGSGKWVNAKSLDSRNKEKRSENGGIADERSDKNPRESSDHVIDLEDIPNSFPASEVSPRNGGLQTTGCSIIISDSDDDCAPGGKKQMGHKRKRDSSPNDNLEKDASSIKTAEMKQQKLGRCDSLVNYFSETVAPSAASHYGKQNKSSSRTHIISGAIEKVRGTQKSCVESPAMASKTPFDCESDDDSTSISSSDDSVDVDELQSMLSAAVEKAKA